MLLCLGGCGFASYQPAPLDAAGVQQTLLERRLDSPGLRQPLAELGVDTGQWPPAQWDVEALTAAALVLNPELEAARAAWTASRAGLQTAAQRPNPEFGFGGEHHSDTPGDETPWGLAARLALVIETGGKRAARQALAEARALVAEEQVAVTAWALRSAIRRACVAWVGAGRQLEVLAARRAVLDEAIALLERRVALGAAGALEASALRIEAQRLELAGNQARADRVEATAALAGALGIPPAGLGRIHIVLPDWEQPLDAAALPPGQARARALLARHDVRAGLARYAVAEAELQSAVAAQYPDLVLSPGIFFEQTDTIWELGSAAVLPLAHRNQGQIAEALAGRDAEAARFEALQARVIGEVEAAALRYAEASRAWRQTTGLLTALQAQAGVLARQVELGYADRMAGLRARLELATARELRETALLGVQRARSDLEQALQRPLDQALQLPLLPRAVVLGQEGGQ